MARQSRDRKCSKCGGRLRASLYDVAFVDPDTEVERLFFSISGSLCLDCRDVEIGREAKLLLEIDPSNATLFVIESDSVLVRRTAAA